MLLMLSKLRYVFLIKAIMNFSSTQLILLFVPHHDRKRNLPHHFDRAVALSVKCASNDCNEVIMFGVGVGMK